MAMKFVGAKISAKLYQKLQEYKEKYAINSDSEAIRDILRRVLIETDSRN